MGPRALFLLGALGLSLGQAGHTQMRPASSAQIVEAVESCMSSFSGSGVDKAKLAARGWNAATASSTDGRPLAMPMAIYSKDSVIMMVAPGSKPSCFIVSRVKKLADTLKVRDGLAKSLKTAPFGEINGGPMWLLPSGNAVQFAVTGSRDKPSVRIGVVHSSGDKK